MDFLLIYYFLCCDIKTIDCFGVCTKYWGDLSKVWAGLRGFKGRMVIEDCEFEGAGRVVINDLGKRSEASVVCSRVLSNGAGVCVFRRGFCSCVSCCVGFSFEAHNTDLPQRALQNDLRYWSQTRWSNI
ncbi:MAG: hypothetical protein CVV36_07785 [Candidatus Methanoperedenaceae archaeon HGW-Methanoperedenaceae-1]|nr:MAG: hypothetical protein CVV36_07785 [Candidatus Methanoperedenaceae archaeon HGW-Methanoperedenaceae-1]